MDRSDVPAIRLDEVGTEQRELDNGRRLAFARFGRSGRTPVYYFHGTPGSRLEAAPADPWAAEHGFELFAIDRPGCGASPPAPGYRMTDWPNDVLAFARAMGHERFGVIGYSGGGSYCDTCAWAIPDSLLFAYDLGGWAPVAQVEELQAHLAPLDRFFLRRAANVGFLFRLPFALIGFAARRLGDRAFVKSLQSSMGDDDRELLLGNANLRSFFQGIVRESFRQGNAGPADDAIRCYSDWGFHLSEIRFPLRLWHGTDDKFASLTFAEYKHCQIPESELSVFEGRGHLHLPTEYAALFADARERLERGQTHG